MLSIDTYFEDALVETCIDKGMSRPRVRTIHQEIPTEWRVEFPRDLREKRSIGTRFRCDLKVCQKTNRDGSPKGKPYLRANFKTITPVSDYTPDSQFKAILDLSSKSGRAYTHLEIEGLVGKSFQELRCAALGIDPKSHTKKRTINERQRNESIKAYVRFRANAACECCEKDAPFLAKDGKPYLEVHHIHALSDGGEDSIHNTAAICPSCHSEITHGIDGGALNSSLKQKIVTKEASLLQ